MPACQKPPVKEKKSRFPKKVKEHRPIGLFQKKVPKQKRIPPSVLKHVCDLLWSLIVRKSTPLCQWCGLRAAIHAHHIFSRQCIPTRHALQNGVALCGGCHMKAHQHTILFIEHAKRVMLPRGQFDLLREQAYEKYEEAADYAERKILLLAIAAQRNITLPPKLEKEKQNVYGTTNETGKTDPPGRTIPHQEAPETLQEETPETVDRPGNGEDHSLGFGIEELFIGTRIDGDLIE